MKKILCMMLLNAAFSGILKAQNYEWAKRAGLWAYDYGYGITTDNSGNIYVAGKYEMEANFSGTVVPCQGNHDIYVAKYSPSGALAWVRTAGGHTGDYATCVSADDSYVYIGGEIEGAGAKITFVGSSITLYAHGSNDIFIAKYDNNGNLLWARRAGDIYYEKALGITHDNAGNVYVCGLYNTTATFGGNTTISGYGENDIFLAKYDANGNFLWVRKAGGVGRDEAKSVVVDNAGNVYISGMFKYTADFSGTQVNSNGYFDAFLAKYSANGDFQWVKTAGAAWDDVAWSMTMDDAGKIFVAGEFNASVNFGGVQLTTEGSSDIFVARYNSSGNVEWAKRAGGNGEDRARGIGTEGNTIFITGQFAETAGFGTTYKTAADVWDIFTAALSNNGDFLWANTVGGVADAPEELGYESGIAICAESNGNVYATGALLSGGVFGNTTLNAYSRTDIFIAKMKNGSGSGGGEEEEEPVQTELIAAGSSWKYLDNGSNQGTAWKEISFNDTGWKTGNTEMGYGDGDEATVVSYGSNSSSKYITTYFRKTFTVSNPSSYSSLELGLLRDDGAVVYINGTKVVSDNMPANANYSTPALSNVSGSNGRTFFTHSLNSSVLVAGNNVIAVELHQVSPGSSDISFNLRLRGNTSTGGNTSTELVAAGSSWKYLDDGSDQSSAWKSTSFSDTGWKTGNAELGYGDGDETTVVSYGPNPSNRYITTYFRKTFNVTDASSVNGLELSLIRDDGAVVYLNGTEVHRNNMPSGTISYSTLASTSATATESVYQTTAISATPLVSGANLIAVEIHQHSPGSSDLSFNLKLRTLSGTFKQDNPDSNSPELLSFKGERNGNGIFLSWMAAGQENNHYFIVERGITEEDFQPVGIVMSDNNSVKQNNYFFMDSALFQEYPDARTFFYRLNFTDYDGRANYSHVISVTVDTQSSDIKTEEVLTWSLYPHPVKESFTVMASPIPEGKILLHLYDMTGRQVGETTLGNLPAGVDVSKLAPGFYMVGIKSGEGLLLMKKIMVGQ